MVATPALSKTVALPIALDTGPDARVLGIAAAATLFAALLAGVLPALRLSGRDLQMGMAGSGRTTGPRSGQQLTRMLVAVQLALSLLLVTAGGLLSRTMLRVMAVDPASPAAASDEVSK